MRLMLLLALILPLQGFAAAWNCGSPETGAPASHQHCAPGSGTSHSDDAHTGAAHSGPAHSGAAHTADAPSHHHCGTCCAAAIAALPFGWIAPPSITPPIALPHNGPPPKVALDRLDRPPRHV